MRSSRCFRSTDYRYDGDQDGFRLHRQLEGDRALRAIYDSGVEAAYIYLAEDGIGAGDAEFTYACDPNEVGGMIHLDFDRNGVLLGIVQFRKARDAGRSCRSGGGQSESLVRPEDIWRRCTQLTECSLGVSRRR
jgi:uncharacterized protein YuzE